MNHKRHLFAKAAIVIVSAGAGAVAGPEYALAVCDCTAPDVLPSNNTTILSAGSVAKTLGISGSSLSFLYATVPSDDLYSFRSSAAPDIRWRLQTDYLELPVQELYQHATDIRADVMRWSYTGEVWTSTPDSTVEIAGGGTKFLVVDVDGVYADTNHYADGYVTRLWVLDVGGSGFDSAIEADADAIQISMPIVASW